MSAQALEGFLARLYVDDELRREFLARPATVARAHGLNEQDADAVAALSRGDLELAAVSYAMKRQRHALKRKKWLGPTWLQAMFGHQGAGFTGD